MTMLDQEKQVRKDERARTLAERCPELQMSGLSLQDLQVHLSLKHFIARKEHLFWYWLKRKSTFNHITVLTLHANHFSPPTPSGIKPQAISFGFEVLRYLRLLKTMKVNVI